MAVLHEGRYDFERRAAHIAGDFLAFGSVFYLDLKNSFTGIEFVGFCIARFIYRTAALLIPGLFQGKRFPAVGCLIARDTKLNFFGSLCPESNFHVVRFWA